MRDCRAARCAAGRSSLPLRAGASACFLSVEPVLPSWFLASSIERRAWCSAALSRIDVARSSAGDHRFRVV